MKNRLADVMKEKNIKAPGLAALAGTTSQQIYRLMKGQRGLDLRWISILSKALSVSPNELIEDGKASQAAASLSENVSLDTTIACMAAINDLSAQKKIPQGETRKLLGKAVKYFIDDFAVGKTPSDAAIKKYILSLID